jgi:glycosyltransferase involved in cell wall biosynthesis
MLNRLPVVATRVSAVPEIVVDGVTGLLADAGDADAIASSLRQLLDDASRRQALGEAGYERVRAEFSVGRMTERTIAVYEEALGR